jgi:hypothetical protein
VGRAYAIADPQTIGVFFIDLDNFGAKLVAKELLGSVAERLFDFVVAI